MDILISAPFLLQVLIPLVLLGWLAASRDPDRADWLARGVAVGGYLAAVAVAGLWSILPLHLVAAYAALLAFAIFRSLRGSASRTTLPTGGARRVGFVARSLLALGMVGLAGYAMRGRQPVAGPPVVDLDFPLSSGTYYVANGGSRELLNAHLMTLEDPRFRAYRGQSYGVDLLKLDRYGLRASGLLPHDPSAYAIFGDTVVAPCAGTVIRAIDGLEDLPPPRVDRSHMEGNHVLIDCDGVWVLLAHFQRGSVQVRTGEAVVRGQALGRVGNTGNSDEPHLHIHAQRPGTSEAPLSGEPLQMRFDGRYLARNALVRTGR